MKPTRFSPISRITEANNIITTGDAKLVKALPVIAQMTPIILNIIDNPKENESICKNSLLLFAFE